MSNIDMCLTLILKIWPQIYLSAVGKSENYI